MSKHSLNAAAALLMAGVAFANETTEFFLTADDYAAAGQLDDTNLASLVKNGAVDPHWVGDSIWYRRDEGDGHSVVMVDADSGTRRAPFDIAAMAEELEPLVNTEADHLVTMPEQIALEPDGYTVKYRHAGRGIVCTG